MSTTLNPPAPVLAVPPAEAARLLGLSRPMIYKLIRSGELRSVTIGRTRRVPMTELERLIDVGGGGGATRSNALGQPARSSGALLDRSDPAPSPGARRSRAVEQLVLVPGR